VGLERSIRQVGLDGCCSAAAAGTRFLVSGQFGQAITQACKL
jgi:hypothetical protein